MVETGEKHKRREREGSEKIVRGSGWGKERRGLSLKVSSRETEGCSKTLINGGQEDE